MVDEEALKDAWADFRKHPGKYGYDDLMKFVPPSGRSAWHEKAMDAAQAQGATEPAATKLEKAHPGHAARLCRAQGMRIVNARKSKYYNEALSNFTRAKRCNERAGLAPAWEQSVRWVRADHHRKTGFISHFEAMATGSGPKREPSFLERAKARWGGRRGDQS